MDNPSPLVAVDIADARWLAGVADPEALARTAACGAYAAGAGAELWRRDGVEISILLADAAALQRLNNQYRGKDRPTNVLSFSAMAAADPPPPPGMPLLLGDIAISFDTALGEAAEEHKTLEDHLCHLVVHGMLHLLGFDHQSEAPAAEMERLEIAVLAKLGIANPYDDVGLLSENGGLDA